MKTNRKESMNTALTTTPAGLTPHSVGEAQTMAEMLSKSTLVPEHFRGKPSDVFMAIAYGLELGMPPVTSLASIAVIKGKPTLYAQSMVALVLSSGKAKYFRCVESDTTHAVYETHRISDPEPARKEFTYEDAKAASLAGGMYSKYPKQMLEARAKAYLARDVYPDVLHGLMSTEEAQDAEPSHGVDVAQFEEPSHGVDVAQFEEPTTPAEVADVVEAEVVEVSPIDQIVGCRTIEELEGLIPSLKQLKGDTRKDALAIYSAHKKTIQGAAA